MYLTFACRLFAWALRDKIVLGNSPVANGIPTRQVNIGLVEELKERQLWSCLSDFARVVHTFAFG